MLYLIPTPIGNLEDITLRALRLLKEVDAIMAEDTRQTLKLLRHYEIEKPLISFHQHNEHKSLERVVDRLATGENLALVSDAGTPGISDPGFLLVRECIAKGVDVQSLPGATAFVPALVNSGLPCDRFVFEGFLPHKKGRQKRWEGLVEETRTTVFYESPYRLLKFLEEAEKFVGSDRQISVSRELTKMFEETKRGSISEIKNHFETHAIKGEFVICLDGKEVESSTKRTKVDL